MTNVNMTVQLDEAVYLELLKAANEVGVPVSDFARATIANYLEENYAEV
jgi:hypothetical protein